MKRYYPKTYRVSLELDGARAELLLRVLLNGAKVRAVRTIKLLHEDGTPVEVLGIESNVSDVEIAR